MSDDQKIEAERFKVRQAFTHEVGSVMDTVPSDPGIWDRLLDWGRRHIIKFLAVSVMLLAVNGLLQAVLNHKMTWAILGTQDQVLSLQTVVIENTSTTSAALKNHKQQIELLMAINDAMQAPPESQKVHVSMYTSRPEETDDTPCLGAAGKDICVLQAAGEQVCANNDVPFGTIIRIYGLGACTVWDRMNERFTGQGQVDWYVGQGDAAVQTAKSHGVRDYMASILVPTPPPQQPTAATSTK